MGSVSPAYSPPDEDSKDHATAQQTNEQDLVLVVGLIAGFSVALLFLSYIVLAQATGEQKNFSPGAINLRLAIDVVRALLIL